MVLSIVLILLLVLLLYLLLLPLVLYVDTEHQQYFVRAGALAKASIEGHTEELFKVRLNILFFNWSFYPLQEIAKRRQKRVDAKKKKSVRKKDRAISVQRIFGILRSFEVKRFFINIDTGDVIWNAKLYPLCSLINYYGGNVNVNFNGSNQLALHLQNRPINILKSIIHSKN